MIKKDLIRDILNQYLKISYIWLCSRLEHFQDHIEILYDKGIINTFSRNSALELLEEIGRNSINEYKNFSKKINENQIKLKLSAKELSHCIKILNTPALLPDEILDLQLFYNIKIKLITIGINYGYSNLEEATTMITEIPNPIKSIDNISIFSYLNKSLIISSLKPKLTKNKYGDLIFFEDYPRPESFLGIKTHFEICVTDGISYVIDGYFKPDSLNIKYKAGELSYPSINQKKKEIENRVFDKYPYIDQGFLYKYLKYSHSALFLIKTHKQYIADMINDYYTYQDLIALSIESLKKKLISSSLDNMSRIIYLLLLGNKKSIINGSYLYNDLKDKNHVSYVVSRTIYSNLPYHLQKKIKKIDGELNKEIERIKSIKTNNIDIKKQIAINSDIPNDAIEVILEKHNEAITSPDNAYKAMLAVDALLKFPWKPKDIYFENINKCQHENLSFIKSVAKNLDKTVYGHQESKQLLLQLVANWRLNKSGKGTVIGLHGPPGCGKTMLARSISEALNLPFVVIKFAGMNDVSDLVGHGYTYNSATYGSIVERMIKAGSWRCVMLLDEIDKCGSKREHHGSNDILGHLVHLLDTEENSELTDRFFGTAVKFDLSGAIIICTYNDRDALSTPILDRIDEVPVKAYSENEKIEIVDHYLLKDIAISNSFDYRKIKMPKSSTKYIIENHTREAGVRGLKRCLQKILRKMNLDRIYLRGPFRSLLSQSISKKYLTQDKWPDNLSSFYKDDDIINLIPEKDINNVFNMNFLDPIVIDRAMIDRYLKKSISSYTEIHKTNLAGVVNGLYATSIGTGGIIPIQILPNYHFSSKNKCIKLELTGNQGKDMVQSVTCAYTITVHMLAEEYKKQIAKKFPDGFLVHNPDISSPKDGPSAGCAFAVAFASIILEKKVNRYISMTGELEATGKVTKIGGLQYKLIGAKKAGVKLIFISKENIEDYIEVKKKYPELFDGNFKVKAVEHIFEILSNKNVILGIKHSDFDLAICKEFLKV